MKIIVSGCSYSRTPYDKTYSKFLNEIYGYHIENTAKSGQSNQSIIKTLFDWVKTYDVRDSYLICQLTFTHRIGMFHDVFDRWHDYQPYGTKITQNQITKFNKITTQMYLKEFNELSNDILIDEIGNDLLKFYETYIKWIYNDKAEFESLMLNVDMFNEWVKLNNNKVLFIYWPQLTDIESIQLKERNFFNIDGNYSMHDYTKRNQLTDIDGHMNEAGNRYIADKINEWILK